MGRSRSPKLSKAQFDIMSVVWSKGEATIAEVLREINSGRKQKLRRSTIQIQMYRLEDKGWLTHKEEGRTFVFRALRSREEAQADIAVDMTKQVFDGSCAELVKCLFKHKKISSDEISRIRRLIDKEKRSK